MKRKGVNLWSYVLGILFPRPFTINDIGSFERCGNSSHALFSYKDKRVRNMIRYLKHTNDREVLKVIAKEMNLRIERNPGSIYIPVPVSRSTMKKRGFNQVRYLAYVLAQMNDGVCIPSSVVVKKETQKQALVGRGKRKENIADAFSVRDPSSIVGKECIIIDDVMTTGATVNELARVLYLAGAKRVQVYAVAH